MNNTRDLKVCQENFRFVPLTVAQRHGHKLALLWAAASRYVPMGGDIAWPTVSRLSADLGVSERTVKRRMAKAKETGAFRIDPRPGSAAAWTLLYGGHTYVAGNGTYSRGKWLRIPDWLWDSGLSHPAQMLVGYADSLTTPAHWGKIRRKLGLPKTTMHRARNEARRKGYLKWRGNPPTFTVSPFGLPPHRKHRPPKSALSGLRDGQNCNRSGEGDSLERSGSESIPPKSGLSHTRPGQKATSGGEGDSLKHSGENPRSGDNLNRRGDSLKRRGDNLERGPLRCYTSSTINKSTTTNSGRAREAMTRADTAAALPDNLDIPMVVVKRIDIETAEQLQTACGLKQWNFPRLSDAIRAATSEADQKGIGPQPVADAVAELASEDAFSVSNPTALLRKSIWPRHRDETVKQQRERRRERARKRRKRRKRRLTLQFKLLDAWNAERRRHEKVMDHLDSVCERLGEETGRPDLMPDFKDWAIKWNYDRNEKQNFRSMIEWTYDDEKQFSGPLLDGFRNYVMGDADLSQSEMQAIADALHEHAMARLEREARRRYEKIEKEKAEKRQKEQEKQRKLQEKREKLESMMEQDELAGPDDLVLSRMVTSDPVDRDIIQKVYELAKEHDLVGVAKRCEERGGVSLEEPATV